MIKRVDFEDLVGKTLTKVIGDVTDDSIEFYCDDGTIYYMYHEQDCCESVSIEDINGDWEEIIGSEIILADESQSYDSDSQDDDGYYYESCTWTFYTIRTQKGGVDIRWYGTSNGYYSESVDIYKETKDDNAM